MSVEDELFGGDKQQLNLNVRPTEETDDEKRGGKKGVLLLEIRKPKRLDNWAERIICKCGKSYDREKNHEWRATLSRDYKSKVDQCYIYCSCGEKLFENAAPDFVKDIVKSPSGEFTTSSTSAIQIDKNVDEAVRAAHKFLIENKEKFNKMASKFNENENVVLSNIDELYRNLQIIAAYYARQTPGSKILVLNDFSFSPKDGIGYNRYSRGIDNVLPRISSLENETIDKMNVHPRLKEILRAFKILSFYRSYFSSGRYNNYNYSNNDNTKINIFDITNDILGEFQRGALNFSVDKTWKNKEQDTATNTIHKMSINQRLKTASNYLDHYNRMFLSFQKTKEVLNLHFANEIFVLLKLKYEKKQYQKSR